MLGLFVGKDDHERLYDSVAKFTFLRIDLLNCKVLTEGHLAILINLQRSLPATENALSR